MESCLKNFYFEKLTKKVNCGLAQRLLTLTHVKTVNIRNISKPVL